MISKREKYSQCLNQTLNLGHSTRDVDEKLSETHEMISEAKALRRDFSGEVLTNYENYLAERLALLQKARYVFSCVEEANNKFDILETAINDGQDNENMEACFIVTDKMASEAKDVTTSIKLSEAVNHDASGLEACLQTLKQKSQFIHHLYDQLRSKRQKRKSMSNFNVVLNEVNQWLLEINISSKNESIGLTVQESRLFTEKVKETLRAVQRKSQEIEGMLG